MAFERSSLVWSLILTFFLAIFPSLPLSFSTSLTLDSFSFVGENVIHQITRAISANASDRINIPYLKASQFYTTLLKSLNSFFTALSFFFCLSFALSGCLCQAFSLIHFVSVFSFFFMCVCLSLSLSLFIFLSLYCLPLFS